ncbi:hypothetical protein CVIRNUC_002647 [Coccomyxa viridis]|uniref:Uncharacterized protein n=1 Tax=Coccomyxa viridis TaxID=1274662 RepID=A0AAV1HW99_9CHLO|nr:hypothetical protein CVIRNUC_002647 [Coccomyxa viridis]
MMAASLAHHPLAVRLHHAGCMVICSALSDFDIPGIASLIARCRKTHRHFLLPKYGPWPLCGMLQHGTLSGMPLLPSLAEKCCNHLPAAALLIFSFWALSDAIVCGQPFKAQQGPCCSTPGWFAERQLSNEDSVSFYLHDLQQQQQQPP